MSQLAVSDQRVLVEALESRTLLSAASASSLQHIMAVPAIHVLPRATNTTPSGYTPAQMRHAYGFDRIVFGNGTVAGDGAGQTIAIVNAFHDPYLSRDLATFCARWGLPPMDGRNGRTTLTVLPMSRGIDSDANWAMETALDVEWAHAMAPKAHIVLVEATSNSLADLLAAVDEAARKISHVSVVSMSWGAGEFFGEQAYDSHFSTIRGHKGVTFVAASGDSGAPVGWPAVSPNVVAVGGTTLPLDAAGNYGDESAWWGSGGGVSLYEAKPRYQSTSAGMRSNPDLAYNADPSTGVSIYNSFAYNGQTGWFTLGGTSVGSPQVAALIAVANQGRSLSGKKSLDGRSQTLPAIYAAPSNTFHDILTGMSTGSPIYWAGAGYDLATGRGSPDAVAFTRRLLLA